MKILGEGFAYDVTVQNKTLLLMFYNGALSALVFKT
jgi:dynein light chain 4